jgi:hypothetical protein
VESRQHIVSAPSHALSYALSSAQPIIED